MPKKKVEEKKVDSVEAGHIKDDLMAYINSELDKRLEKAGYVTRGRSKEDERITIISITPQGEALKEECKDIPLKMAKKGSPLNEKDAKELYRLLSLFLDAE